MSLSLKENDVEGNDRRKKGRKGKKWILKKRKQEKPFSLFFQSMFISAFRARRHRVTCPLEKPYCKDSRKVCQEVRKNNNNPLLLTQQKDKQSFLKCKSPQFHQESEVAAFFKKTPPAPNPLEASFLSLWLLAIDDLFCQFFNLCIRLTLYSPFPKR